MFKVEVQISSFTAPDQLSISSSTVKVYHTKSCAKTWRQGYLLQFWLCDGNIIHLYAKWKRDFVCIVAKTNSQKPNGSSPSPCVVKTVFKECFVVCYRHVMDGQKLALYEFKGFLGFGRWRWWQKTGMQKWGHACLEMFVQVRADSPKKLQL